MSHTKATKSYPCFCLVSSWYWAQNDVRDKQTRKVYAGRRWQLCPHDMNRQSHQNKSKTITPSFHEQIYYRLVRSAVILYPSVI